MLYGPITVTAMIVKGIPKRNPAVCTGMAKQMRWGIFFFRRFDIDIHIPEKPFLLLRLFVDGLPYHTSLDPVVIINRP